MRLNKNNVLFQFLVEKNGFYAFLLKNVGINHRKILNYELDGN